MKYLDKLNWRRNGTPIIIFIIMTSSFFWGHVGVGYSVLLFLTVPCAIKKINNNKLFWYARQLYFILFALLNIFKDKLI